MGHVDVKILLVFMAIVAVASYIQTLTGFALSLILLGLVAMFGVAPIADAANAAMILSLVNAWSYFRFSRQPPAWGQLRPVIASHLVGVALGVSILAWLSGVALEGLRFLLGVSIVGCAVALMLQTQPRATPSGKLSFSIAGFFAGTLGGLFSSPGPPLVYHLYRQPLSPVVIRTYLISVFSAGAVIRLGLVLMSGQFSTNAVVLTACAIPVVHVVTQLGQKYPVPLSPTQLRWLCSVLLVVTGGSLVITAIARFVTTQ
jgi:uncharacterized membrane protein YfcA